MATRKTTTKTTKKTTKKRATKKRTTKKRTPRKAKATPAKAGNGELELVVKDEGLKVKLMAASLLFDREDSKVRAEIQPELDKLLARAQRNNPGWKKANKMRIDAINELIKTHTDDLPEGYCIRAVKLEDGTYTAVHNPPERGKLLKA